MIRHSSVLEHSIPHNVAIRQANLSSIPQSQVNLPVSNAFGQTNTPIQRHALDLYNLGFNVFPQPHGRKAGFPWRQLQYTRLHATHPIVGVEALFQGKCNIAVMCGRTSGNLFIIDCETQNALDYHVSQLRQRNIPLWIVETARGGHIYLQCSDGEVASIESGVLRDAEIRGSRGYVLAAGSIHPTGMIYRWQTRDGSTPPCVSARMIDWLTNSNGKPIKLRLTGGKGKSLPAYSPLSRATQEYLANGDTIAEGSRNQRLFNAACDMAGNGHNQHSVENQLAPIAERSGLARHEVYATIRSAFSRDRKPARPQSQITRKPSSGVWKHALTFAQNQQWLGRTGTSDKLVFLALIERAKTASNDNDVFRASLRELSVLARTNINTTQKALKRLKEAKIIFYAGEDKTSQASLWRFSDNVIKEGHLKSESSPATPLWIGCGDSILNSSDAMERGALGFTGLSVYKAMLSLSQPMMPSALSALMSVPVHRVNYALGKLSGYGLVQRVCEGWCALKFSDAELDERVARPAGKLGRGTERRERYAAQRAMYVGNIILQARVDMFREEFLYRYPEIEQMVNLDSCSDLTSSFIVGDEVDEGESPVKLWRCPNCGQVHFAEVPPDMCDFCQDFTTWKPLEGSEADELSDPMVQLALELGAEVYIIEDGKRRLLAPCRKPPK
jgi:hypothetical protein